MDKSYIADNLTLIIEKHGIPRLLICSEFGISLALLDDFENNRLRMPDKMLDRLYELFYEGKSLLSSQP